MSRVCPRSLARLLPILTALPWVARAEESALPAELGSSILQMIFGLGIVLVLLLATLWLLKRIGQPRGPVANFMRVVAGMSIGPRERVVILELGNSWLVLGIAPGQVTTLAEIPRQELAPAAHADDGAAPNAPKSDFAAWLTQSIRHRGKA